MKVVGLFSGSKSWEKPFISNGDDVFTTDFDTDHKVMINCDIRSITPELVRHFMGDHIDVMVLSPPCTCFSIASCSTHWFPPEESGDREPRSDNAKDALEILNHALYLIRELNPTYWIMENPRGLMRKMPQVQEFHRETVWYCTYGDIRAKPTDLWGVWPDAFETRPQCHNGNPNCHHQPAPRGAKTGTQGLPKNQRSLIPSELCREWFEACKNAISGA